MSAHVVSEDEEDGEDEGERESEDEGKGERERESEGEHLEPRGLLACVLVLVLAVPPSLLARMRRRGRARTRRGGRARLRLGGRATTRTRTRALVARSLSEGKSEADREGE